MDDIRRFLPLVGTLVALIGLAIAGAALTNNKQIPRVDPSPVVLHTQIQKSSEGAAPSTTPGEPQSSEVHSQPPVAADTAQSPAANQNPAPPPPPALQLPGIPPVVLPVVPQVPLNYQPLDVIGDVLGN